MRKLGLVSSLIAMGILGMDGYAGQKPTPINNVNYATTPSRQENLELRAHGDHIQEKNKPVKLGFYLVNNSRDSIWAISSLDGSGDKERYPFVWLDVYDSEGRSLREGVDNTLIRMCSWVNELEKEDLFKIAPGDSLDILGWSDIMERYWKPKKGRFSVVAHYETDAKREEDFYGRTYFPGSQEDHLYKSAISQIPRVKLSVQKDIEVK